MLPLEFTEFPNSLHSATFTQIKWSHSPFKERLSLHCSCVDLSTFITDFVEVLWSLGSTLVDLVVERSVLVID